MHGSVASKRSGRCGEWGGEMNELYFVGNQNAIKIGFSSQVERRLRAFAIGNPGKIELLGSVRGSLEDEAALHEHLAQYRVCGEWFADCSAVRETIAKVVSYGGVPQAGLSCRRKRTRPPTDEYTEEAQEAARIIARHYPDHDFKPLENELCLPSGLLWTLFYRPPAQIVVSSYIAVLLAAQKTLSAAQDEINREREYIDDKLSRFASAPAPTPEDIDNARRALAIARAEATTGPNHPAVRAAEALLVEDDDAVN